MDATFVSNAIVPGAFALLLFLTFAYLYRQSKEPYFRAWQLSWGSYSLYYATLLWTEFGSGGAPAHVLQQLLLAAVFVGIFLSTRLIQRPRQWDGIDLILTAGLAALALASGVRHLLQPGALFRMAWFRLEYGAALLLLVSAVRFYRVSRIEHRIGLRLLSISLTVWALLLSTGRGSDLLGDGILFLAVLPQMLIAISMVIALFENERRAVQEHALAFSSLEVDASRPITQAEVAPALEKLLSRLADFMQVKAVALSVSPQWRAILPSVSLHFPPRLMGELESAHAAEYLIDMAYRGGGLVLFRNLPQLPEPLPAAPPGYFERTRNLLTGHGIRSLTAVSVQTRSRHFGAIVLPEASLSGSQKRLLMHAAMQIGMTLENFLVVHEIQRRTGEYELLTQIGQVISSRLDPDDILRTIHSELGRLFDTANFYIAVLRGDELHFEFETLQGNLLEKRSRKTKDALADHVIRTAQPLLVKSDMERTCAKLGLPFSAELTPKSYIGVPIFIDSRAIGVMAALNFDRAFVYEERDVEVLQTAAGQVGVAMANARLFSEEQRRTRYLGFLNQVSKRAISSQDSKEMLAEIVAELERNFDFDHIGIGVLDYATKEIEIKAEAGTAKALGMRVPLGVGILGRCARTSQIALVRAEGQDPLLGILPGARSVLSVPLSYGESLLGVLNLESKQEHAFDEQEVLTLRTLADLLAAALHNAFVFQKLQQQSITDGLTGIKTRRYFLEAVQGEWKRAVRLARRFSVVLVDLDKFKAVNDSFGHLEGDLVLARVGRLLEQKCRQSNVVARYGGDEFVILMPETGIEQAQALSERLRLWLSSDPMLNSRSITGSFGVGSFPVHGATVEEIIRVADAGMYISKNAGGNCVSTAEPLPGSEARATQRQIVTAYVEGFLQREHNGPGSADELVGTVRKMCETVESREAVMEVLLILSRASEARELQGEGHGDAVAQYLEPLARSLGMSPEELAELVYAARVHDIGKLVVSESILGKAGPLTEEEYHIVKMHPAVGAEIVACISESENLQKIVRQHHEWLSGAGYPDGLLGEAISLGARVLHVVDAFVNMTSDRPFAPARTAHEAMAELERNSGTQFDGMVVRLFLRQLKGEQVMKV